MTAMTQLLDTTLARQVAFTGTLRMAHGITLVPSYAPQPGASAGVLRRGLDPSRWLNSKRFECSSPRINPRLATAG